MGIVVTGIDMPPTGQAYLVDCDGNVWKRGARGWIKINGATAYSFTPYTEQQCPHWFPEERFCNNVGKAIRDG